MSNLTYSIDNGWIKTVNIDKTVKVKGGTIPQRTTFYEITAKGIDKIEGGSQFEPKERYSGINITASGNNIINLGDGNVVNAQYANLHRALEELKDAISNSNELTNIENIDLLVDAESIKEQSAKSQLNKIIISQLWNSLEKSQSFHAYLKSIIK